MSICTKSTLNSYIQQTVNGHNYHILYSHIYIINYVITKTKSESIDKLLAIKVFTKLAASL